MVKGTSASFAVYWLLAMLVVVRAVELREMAVECNPRDVIAPCMAAYTGGSPPTKECCDKLKEQGPCYCQYIKNPALRPYVESPNGKMIISSCGFTLPNCS